MLHAVKKSHITGRATQNNFFKMTVCPKKPLNENKRKFYFIIIAEGLVTSYQHREDVLLQAVQSQLGETRLCDSLALNLREVF